MHEMGKRELRLFHCQWYRLLGVWFTQDSTAIVALRAPSLRKSLLRRLLYAREPSLGALRRDYVHLNNKSFDGH